MIKIDYFFRLYEEFCSENANRNVLQTQTRKRSLKKRSCEHFLSVLFLMHNLFCT